MKEPAEITLRDYFAAKAMQAILTRGESFRATDCYEIADAMIAERNKGEEE